MTSAAGDVHVGTLMEEARRSVLELTIRQGHPIVGVDSPPGAGKTNLVEDVVATAVLHARMRVGVVAPRAEQTYEILRRVAANFPINGIQVLQSSERQLPPDLAANPQILPPVSRARDLRGGAGVVVGTAAKFLVTQPDLPDRAFDLLVCDEAYQLPYKDYAPLMALAGHHLLVGDPGQLPPLVQVDTARFEAARSRVHWPVPKEVLRRFPLTPVVGLPASYRLVQDSVSLLQPAFYPDLPFVSAANAAERRIGFAAGGLGSLVDPALDLIEHGASMVALLLPARDVPPGELDDEVAELAAKVAERILQRRGERASGAALIAADIGIADAHVASGAAVGCHLRARGISTDELVVQTPELWQGLQRPIMIVKHPLSGHPRLDRFALEPGRWCVMLSRHQSACVIVGRDGIGNAVKRHQHDCAERPLGAEDMEWLGWRAHTRLWSDLSSAGRIIRVGD
jgi:hypothetical protein